MICIGINHHKAPVQIRELFVVPKHRVREVGEELKRSVGVEQCVILSTCNRLEIYAWPPLPDTAEKIMAYFSARTGISVEETARFFDVHAGRDALVHACRVMSGLDSMVLGETEVLGQAKDAYGYALEAGLTGAELNRAFQRFFHIVKRVRSESKINVGATSIGSVAVVLAERIFGCLQGAGVLVLGAGDMSRQTAKALQSRGAHSVFVANRSYDRACALAESIGGEAIHYDRWMDYLKTIDVVIASTAAPGFIITKEMLKSVREMRKYRSLFAIDISVPRNIDPRVAEIDEVYCYDIDTLQQIANDARQVRELDIMRCESIINEEIDQYFKQYEC